MMLLWTFQAVKERQLFWTAFCMLSLLENHVSAAETTISGTLPNTPTTMKPTSVKPTTKISTGDPLTTTTTTTSVPLVLENSTPSEKNSNSSPASTPALSPTVRIAQTSPTQHNMSHGTSNETTETLTTVRPLTSVPTVRTKSEVTTSPNTTRAEDSHVMFTCMNIKEVTNTKVICLELNGTTTCEQFIKQKREPLGKALCATNDTCHIQLAKSDVNKKCILLVHVSDKGTDTLDKVLEEKSHDLQKAGIKAHKQENIESHKDYSRKTLIALVTSGLLLAFLGLAGYHLMKRRSWSPMGERLGEDPYYTESGSHGNPAISVASHEQSDLQDKPNLNGGARENGTSQPTSKNGHSTRPHVVADTEL
ncbi:hematopoietic progenitor cell antigen CD34 [Sceloporus undulatus]|uniref:hematopoietic progenitor cell antigen CD34 n=1 Tax=Sceloporus undulatus TaxID=8520 RepID=UPI001C4D1152|nr:hematopoietic progenitor cell antigen CD34 [Sceloporus undulatus]